MGEEIYRDTKAVAELTKEIAERRKRLRVVHDNLKKPDNYKVQELLYKIKVASENATENKGNFSNE